jgi:hypothetical protein
MKIIVKKNNLPCFNTSLKNLKGEEWREIAGAEGYYLVSNYGRVKAVSRYIERGNPLTGIWTKEKILKQACSKNYNHYKKEYTFGMIVRYQLNKKRFAPMVRRLVYEAFIQPLTGEKIKDILIVTKNENGMDSQVSNLISTTRGEIRRTGFKTDRYYSPNLNLDPQKNRKRLLKLNRLKRRKVIQFDLDGKKLKTFLSLSEASLKTAIPISNIWACANGQQSRTKGFVWKFLS